MMPKIAEGDANKVWIVPSEIGKALEGLGSTMNKLQGIPVDVDGPRKRVDMGSPVPEVSQDQTLQETHDQVAAAIAAAEESSEPTRGAQRPPLDQGDPGEPTPQ
jgi:hypothetical protein